jgi:hypothetical protein
MPRKDALEYLNRRLKEAEDSLVQFQLAIIDHGLRVRERDVNGERDITDRCLKDEVAACNEYRRLIDEWSSE